MGAVAVLEPISQAGLTVGHALSVPMLTLPPPSPAMLARLHVIHRLTRELPQVPLTTEHLLHGGMYARTIRIPAGTLMNGSAIRCATILILHGDCAVTAGDSLVELHGYNVLPGSPGRKQSFLTLSDVEMTMIFPTTSQTVEEAENEVFAEAEELMSRRDDNLNAVTVTGE